MPEIPVGSATLFPNSITQLEQAESALETAWEELEAETAKSIDLIGQISPEHSQRIGEGLATVKQLRQELKTQMKQATSRLEFHLDNSQMAVLEWDCQFRIVQWSAGAERIFGWKTAEVIGKKFEELSIVYEADLELVNSVTNKLLEGREPRNSCHNRNYTKDGAVIHCEWNNSAQTDAEGKVVSIISFALDVTERHRTQEELRRREEAFSAIAENATDTIARFDRELRHLYVNKEVQRATGKPASEFIGKSNKELGMSPQLCNLWDQACLKVFRTGQPETIEFDFPTPAGKKYYQCRVIPEFTQNNTVETVLGIARDITDLKQVEAQLRQSEAKFRHVVESNIIGIFFWDIHGEITDANDAFLNMIGYPREDLENRKLSWKQITPPEYISQDEAKVAELEATSKASPFEKEYIRGDGSRVHVLLGAAFSEGSQEFGVSFVLDLTQTKQAETELKRNQELLESILKTIPNFLYIYDVLENKNIYANQAALSIFGYSSQELQNMGNAALSTLIHPDDMSKLIAGMQRLANSQNIHETDDIDYRIQHKNGEWRWVHDRSTIFKRTPDGQIKQVIGSVLDISDRKQAEASLKQQKELLQTIFDNVPVTIAFLGDSGEIEWVNRYWEQLFGWSCEAMKGRDIFAEFYPQPEYRQYILDEIQAANKKWTDFKTRVRDGRIIDTSWASIRLSDGRCIGIGQDITERKQAEAELQELNETLEAQVAQRTAELETFFDALPDRIFVVERENMRQPFVNKALAKMAGFASKKEMQGKTVFECFPPELSGKFYQENMQVFESGEILHLREKFSFEGRIHYYDTLKIPLKNPGGEIYALIGTSRDITELIETKKALSKRTEQLEFANQELESFSYSVSHDLRAPLRHISGFVNALKQRLESMDVLGDRKIVHYLQVIDDSSQKMSLLIDGLLALSRVGRTELIQTPIDLSELVQTAIKLAQPRTVTDLTQTPQTVEFEIGDLPMVTGDPTLLQQVFSNLISNAVKFSRGRNPATIVIDAIPDGTIFVKDNGVGFEMEYADRLFAAFERLHSQREFEGTGIGLAIAWRIIHRHGGTIWAESTPDRGATFYFKLN